MAEWRAIPGYEGTYEVSNDGQVRSLDRETVLVDGRHRITRGQLISPKRTGQDGRPGVDLAHGGRKRRRYIHDLVLTAFVGPRPAGLVACHGNGNLHDNSVGNLRWDTQGNNHRDSVRHGTHWRTLIKMCPRNHRLEAPNLVPSGNGRECLACSRGRANIRRAAARGEVVDLKTVADSYYSTIMAAA